MTTTRRTFGRIRKLPSKRYQAAYNGPDLALHYAPETFDAKIDAEGWLAAERWLIESGRWTSPAAREQRQHRQVTLAEYAGPWLTDREPETPHPVALPGVARSADPARARRRTVAAITPVRVRSWHSGAR